MLIIARTRLARSLSIARSMTPALLAAALMGATPAAAQNPELIVDLLPGTTFESPVAGVAEAENGLLLFAAQESDRGYTLWSTDGTEQGTRRFADPCPGHCELDDATQSHASSRIEQVVFDGSRAYFIFDDGIHGAELWTADGTDAGTRLVADLCLGPCSYPYSYLTLVAGRLYFQLDSEFTGREPWVSDGSSAFTQLIADLRPGPDGSFPGDFVPFGDGVAFRAFLPSLGTEFWRTDGTASGTALIADLCPGNCSGAGIVSQPLAGGSILVTDNQGFNDDGQAIASNLVRLDPDGTVEKLQTLCGVDGVACDNLISRIFPAFDRYYIAEAGQLFSTDGSAPGTRKVLDLPTGADSATSVIGNGQLWLTTSDRFSEISRVYELLDPAVGNGSLIGPRLSSTRSLLPVAFNNGILVFDTADDIDLVFLNGAGLTSGNVGSIPAPTDFPQTLGGPFNLGDRVVFTTDSSTAIFGDELWSIDEAQGTLRKIAKDRVVSLSSDPRSLVPLGRSGAIVFSANTANGAPRDLMLSLGAAGNTSVLIPDIEPAGLRAVDLDAGPRVFFTESRSPDDSRRQAPWLTDGINSSFPLRDAQDVGLSWGREPVTLDRSMVFFADTRRGQKIWRTDGTSPQAELIADLEPSWSNIHEGCGVCSPPIPPGPIFPRELRIVGQGDSQYLALVGRADGSGSELWTSDGTLEGTRLVADLRPGPQGSEPEDLMIAGNAVLFTADDGTGRGLWRWRQGETPLRLRDAGEIITTHSAEGRATWTEIRDTRASLETSDGTVAGTARVYEFMTGALPGQQLVQAGQRLFFALAGADGVELWSSDLTPNSLDTRQVADLAPGSRGSWPLELTEIDGQLLWSADDGLSGRELWQLDPGELVPERLTDLRPGAAPSSPADLTQVATGDGASTVFFTARHPTAGRELWSLDGTSMACDGDPLAHCLQNGRFKITSRWRIPATGETGVGTPLPSTDDSGFFWFFSESNIELVVKVLDGRAVNEAYWLFYGALSDVEYWIDAEDQLTGETRTYYNPPGRFCGEADTGAFPQGSIVEPVINTSVALTEPTPHVDSRTLESKLDSTCVASETELCLLDRFQVSVTWRDHAGNEGVGTGVISSRETGFFWFFDQANIELAVKALDGRGFNDNFWLFYGALSDIEYTIRVVDSVTGAVKEYRNEARNFCGQADTAAFPGS